MENNVTVKIENYNLSYGPVVIFKNFNLTIKKGEIIGIFGPTGTGKTSLLNKITKDYLKEYKISYVFQDNKLIDNLTVLKNIILPLSHLNSSQFLYKQALSILKKINLENKKESKVNVLSGGEKQRVNIGRALAYPCDLLLMDEPFSAQDENNRQNLIANVREIIEQRQITTIIVSHNKNDLESLCSRIILL